MIVIVKPGSCASGMEIAAAHRFTIIPVAGWKYRLNGVCFVRRRRISAPTVRLLRGRDADHGRAEKELVKAFKLPG